LDKETKELVTGIAFIVFLLVLVFFLTNPIGAAVTFVLVGLVGFTIYSKYKTGRWWWTTSGNSPNTSAGSPNPTQPTNPGFGQQPIMTERETVTREVFARLCYHCGAKVVETRTNCPNCGALL